MQVAMLLISVVDICFILLLSSEALSFIYTDIELFDFMLFSLLIGQNIILK